MQCAVAAIALAVVAVAPPARGPMLLLPIATDRTDAIRVAVAHGARLLGASPAAGIPVWADADVVAPLVRAGVLPIDARFSGCGSSPR